jgi:hypothetical protein
MSGFFHAELNMIWTQKIILVLAWATATAWAQPVNPTAIEKILTVEASNALWRDVLAWRAKEPKILVMIVPANPVLARTSVNYFTGKVMI